MEITFIRHAQSENNAQVPHGGSLRASSHPLRQPDPAITALGREQIVRLAAFLPTWWDLRLDREQRRLSAAPLGLQRLHCSLMRRALQSAAVLAEALALPTTARADLHEIGGIYDGREGAALRQSGMTRSEVAAEFPLVGWPAELGQGGWWCREAETFAEAAERAARFAGWLREQAQVEPAARLGIITHGGWLDLLLRELLGQPIREQQGGIRFSHYNTGMTRVDILRGGRVVLRFQNRVPHLTAELLSY
ncbi:MAG: histidine phosphatase family protein [Anaerolineaceae bacterium]|nr:histidine phosphatase family protein [Anaerolineaceae bacterium]